jgi:hypothetical protein
VDHGPLLVTKRYIVLVDDTVVNSVKMARIAHCLLLGLQLEMRLDL